MLWISLRDLTESAGVLGFSGAPARSDELWVSLGPWFDLDTPIVLGSGSDSRPESRRDCASRRCQRCPSLSVSLQSPSSSARFKVCLELLFSAQIWVTCGLEACHREPLSIGREPTPWRASTIVVASLLAGWCLKVGYWGRPSPKVSLPECGVFDPLFARLLLWSSQSTLYVLHVPLLHISGWSVCVFPWWFLPHIVVAWPVWGACLYRLRLTGACSSSSAVDCRVYTSTLSRVSWRLVWSASISCGAPEPLPAASVEAAWSYLPVSVRLNGLQLFSWFLSVIEKWYVWEVICCLLS